VKSAKKAKRDAFMLCAAYSAINLALADYKQKICSSPNIEKTFKL
jgi:hypothetical protein